MDGNRASLSALLTAYMRAHHATHDSPKVFDDFLAPQLFTPEEHAFFSTNLAMALPAFAPEQVEAASDQAAALSAVVRAQMIPLCRSRYTEDCLDQRLDLGASQYVILGAGYDTFAFRCPELASRLRVFEVDHPATQAEKRQRLEKLGWELPESLSFVPVDFTRDDLASGLLSASYDPSAVGVFSWLGVSYYLPRESVFETLRAIGRMSPEGTTLVFDYLDHDAFDPVRAVPAMQRLHAVMQRTGEPMVTGFDPTTLAEELAKVGFRLHEDLGASEIRARLFQGRTDGDSAFAHLRFAQAVVSASIL